MKTIHTAVLLILALCPCLQGNAQWSQLGIQGFTGARADNLCMAISPSGEPYVAYAPFTGSRKVSVMRWNGLAWVYVGSPNFSAGYAEAISIGFQPLTSYPFVAYVDVANSNKATVMQFNGTAWTPVGAPGFTPAGTAYTKITFNILGDPYLAFSDKSQGGGRASVMKYTFGSWQYGGSPGFSASTVTYVGIAMMPLADVPYVAFCDLQFSPPRTTVMQYVSASNSWVNVGPAGFSQNTASDVNIAFPPWMPSGNPLHITYIESPGMGTTYQLNVKKFDAGTSSWVNVGIGFVWPSGAEKPKLAFSSCGQPYVAVIDYGSANKATVVKLSNATIWIPVGSPGQSVGAIAYPDLKIAPFNKMYLSYMDLADPFYGATVKKFESTVPLTVSGTIVPSTCGNVDGCIDITPNGGVPPYTYLWSNQAITQDICNLTCGTYTVTITDEYCNAVTSSWVYDDIIIAGAVCSGSACTGSIDITVSCGVAPYTYIWSNGATTQDIFGLCSGLYCVTVVDAMGKMKICCFSPKKSTCAVAHVQNVNVGGGSGVCYDASQTITVAGSGTFFSVQDGGIANMIAGYNIRYLPGTRVYAGGYVHGRITTTGQYCGSKNHDAEPGVGETIGDSLPGAGGSSFITLYPNPTSGKFILETTSASTKQKVVAEIYSIQGKILIIKDISEGNRHELSVSDLPVGVYFIRVVSGDNVAIQRIIRQ